MFEQILTSHTKKLLKLLSAKNLPESSYLGGGTAIALHLGHRKSADLDFFSKSEFNEIQWEQKLEKELNFKLFKRDWQTLIGSIGETKFSLMSYKYKLVKKLLSFENVKIASLEDLSAMKLSTVISRGTKRDFVDIYFLAKKFTLSELFKLYDNKFGNFNEREIMIKKSLTYFKEADTNEMPEMIIPVKWEEVKKWFIKNITTPS